MCAHKRVLIPDNTRLKSQKSAKQKLEVECSPWNIVKYGVLSVEHREIVAVQAVQKDSRCYVSILKEKCYS